MLNLPEPSEEERLGRDIELTAWFLPNANEASFPGSMSKASL